MGLSHKKSGKSPAPNPVALRCRELWCLGRLLLQCSGAQVLLIGASPRVGVRPLLALDAVVLNVLGVGLFENAAQSGW